MNNKQLYIGYTPNLRARLKKHKEGKVQTTSKYLPVRLAYYEAYAAEADARDREKKLKQYGSSLSFLKKRAKESIRKQSQQRG